MNVSAFIYLLDVRKCPSKQVHKVEGMAHASCMHDVWSYLAAYDERNVDASEECGVCFLVSAAGVKPAESIEAMVCLQATREMRHNSDTSWWGRRITIDVPRSRW